MGGSRRRFLEVGAGALGAARLAGGAATASARRDEPPPPRFRLAMNLELIFPAEMPHPERIAQAAACGARHYGFWGHPEKDIDAMLEAQDRHGLACVSLTGAPRTGWGDGLTRPGAEAAFLEDVEGACTVARRLGAENLITFVGRRQDDVPRARQRELVVAGLRRAGEIAGAHGAFLTLEPLNRVESPQMTLLTAREAYELAAEVDHPRVRVVFDVYHRQLGEGNLTPLLEEGLRSGLVRYVEVGDVPGRLEPGTGEVDYAFLFRRLRELGYEGFVGLEHGTSRDPGHAWDAVRKLAGLGEG